MRLRRSSTLSVFLLAASVFVGYRVVQLWREPLIAPPVPPKKPPAAQGAGQRQLRLKPGPLSITSIVDKDLFDPKRGSDAGEAEEQPSEDLKTAQDLVLLGTIITPALRQAIIRVPQSFMEVSPEDDGRRLTRGERAADQLRRVDLGDSVGGFELTEVEPNKVTLLNGSGHIELVLDFARSNHGTETSPKTGPKPRASREKEPARRLLPRNRRR